MDTKLSALIQFYESFWGRRLQKKLNFYWRKRPQEPTLALGFGLPWADKNVLYAIPTQYGGKGIVWPTEGPCQTLLVDPTKLPIDDKTIGTVWAMHMIDEVPDLWLSEVNRVLKYNGQLHLIVAQPYHPLTRSWPIARVKKKKLCLRLEEHGWHVKMRPIMGWPSMLWYVTAHKLPYHAIKAKPNGCLAWVES